MMRRVYELIESASIDELRALQLGDLVHIYPEVVDPHKGAVLSEGEEGELVLTSLTREALPHGRLASQLAQAVKAYVGVTVTVNVHACGAIERSSGKAKRVVDRRRT